MLELRHVVVTMLVIGALALAWVQDYKADNLVQLGQLNVLVNQVEQLVDGGKGDLVKQVSALGDKQMQLRLLIPGEVFEVAIARGRGSMATRFLAEDIRDGLQSYRGVDFYVVTLTNGQRLALYGASPAISQLHHHGFSLSTLVLTLVVLVLGGVIGIGEWRLSNLKERLVQKLGGTELRHLQRADFKRTYRYIVIKLSEYHQQLADQQYLHELKNTKQDELMSNMMHDMKTPIAALHAFVEAYEDGLYAAGQLDKKMPLVVRNVNHLLHVTDQYDAYLKYAAWTVKANMRRYALSHIVQEVILGVERDFAAIGRTVQLVVMESPSYVVCDLNELKKLLHVLVENAHKYSELDKAIILSAMVRSGMLYITVKDYGIGIAPEMHDEIFDPFVKVDKARASSTKSYGIGLYIAKQIVLNHGGDIQLESSLGIGATFTVMLPAAEG